MIVDRAASGPLVPLATTTTADELRCINLEQFMAWDNAPCSKV